MICRAAARASREGFFIEVLGIEGFSASAPFMVSGSDAAQGGFDPPPLLSSG